MPPPAITAGVLKRRMNRRRQGDLGEASAIDWFTGLGAVVFIPSGHSPDIDLVVEVDQHLLRVQVKTSTQTSLTSTGEARTAVTLATNGGNQSWSGITKRMDPDRFDYLFVLTGDGRRWLIPAVELDAGNAISLGAPSTPSSRSSRRARSGSWSTRNRRL